MSNAITQTQRKSLPKGWKLVALASICSQDKQSIQPHSEASLVLPYLSLEHVEAQTGRILLDPSEGDSANVKSVTHAFDSRHVLYGKLRPYLNKVALPQFSGRCTTELTPLLPAENIDRTFLAWILRRPETVAAAMREKTGSRMPRTNMDYLMSMTVPLPPLSEQKRIVAALGEQLAEVNRARAAVEAQLEATQALPEAFLHQVFDSPEARRWPERLLGSVCDIEMGQSPPGQSYNQDKIGEPLLNGPTEFGPVNPAPVQWTTKPTRIAQPGDILICVRGATTGRKNMADQRYCIGRGLAAIRGRAGLSSTEFIWYALDVCMPSLLEMTTGSTFPNLTKTKLSQQVIRVPAIGEQQRIHVKLKAQFHQFSCIKRGLVHQLDELTELPAKLLEAAFSGRI